MALADQAGVLAVEKLNTETLPLAKRELSEILVPVLEAIVDLNTQIAKIAAESAAWRVIFQRLNLSPPEVPK
jgi:hypothetical protein